MKIHRHLAEQVFVAVLEIFRERRPADKVIESHLKAHRKWGARDRRFFAESVYEMVRHWRRLWKESGGRDEDSLDGANLVPTQVQGVWAALLRERGEAVPEWCPATFVPAVETWPHAVRASIPDWLDEQGRAEFGDEWPELMAALNRPADVYLRANTLRGGPSDVVRRLASEGIEAEVVPGSASAVRLIERRNVFVTEAFREGLFEVQDLASQTVAPLVDPQPGERVVDACAGAGGKTLHLAALMKNRGRILSLDIHDWKLKELRTRAARNGVDIVETRLIDSTKVIKRLDSSVDRVLLDVPCSGLGVLRRNPDTKWRLSPEEIERLVGLQREILGSYSRMVRPGGVLVYATCSLLPAENRRQVDWFLASEAGREFRLDRDETHRPDRDGADGFYAARLLRADRS